MGNNYIIYILAVAVFTLIYSYYEGMREAVYYHIKNVSGLLPKLNEHPMFMAQRLCFAFAVASSLFVITGSLMVSFLQSLALAMTFPFIHDGSFYTHRHRIDKSVYGKGFLDHSTTSTAFLTRFMTPAVRFSLFWTGLFMYFYVSYARL